ncbi:MAG TPA: right-handed parallel beta-helix repeat-containing protein, partial [Actinomycetota bacterium]|nr:right-handed parallel beta-helix repeat-containing protein [Actinomycetota bacterium]
PGSVIVVGPGVYPEEVTVTTPRITIRGVDRFRSVLNGGDTRENGIKIRAPGVTVKNLTVRDYTAAGISVDGSADYTVRRVDAIKNQTFGIYASGSHGGVIAKTFVWGSGDSGVRVDSCRDCGTLIDDVHAGFNFLGYAGTNASGVVVRDSTWINNGVGIAPNTLAGSPAPPSDGLFIYNNVVQYNNYRTVPAAGMSREFGIPFGTGIWLAGVSHSVIRENGIVGHERFGILVTDAIDGSGLASVNNVVIENSATSSGSYDLAWDGSGSDNCFSANEVTGATGPPDIQTTYGCDMRPFGGTTFQPVDDDVDEALVVDPEREQHEPPEPRRPRCQQGRPGCD